MSETEEERKSGLERFLRSLIPNPSLGGFFGMAFWGAILAGVAFFVLKNDTVREWIQEKFPNIAAGLEGLANGAGIDGFMAGATENYLMGLSPEAARTQLEGKDVPPGVAEVLTADAATWQGFLQLVKTANKNADGTPGTVSESTLLNDKTIFALLTQKPDMARALIRALPAPTTTGTPSATTARITAALGTMIATPGQLDTLLNAQNFSLTMEAVAKFSPVPVTAEALGGFVRAAGMRDGVPTEAFRSFITTALSDPSQFQQALTSFILMPEVLANPGALSTLANGIGTLPEAQKDLRDMVQLLKFNAPAVTTLLSTLGTEKTTEFMRLMSANETMGISRFALDAANVAAFRTFATTADVGHLPSNISGSIISMRDASPQELAQARTAAEHNVDISRVQRMFNATDRQGRTHFNIDQTINSLTHGANRTALRAELGKLPPEELAAMLRPLHLTPASMTAMLDLASRIGNHAPNWSNGHAPGTAKVLRALGHMMIGNDMSRFKSLSATELSQFFSVEENRQAFGELMNSFDSSQLDAKTRNLLRVMRDHWQKPDGTGIALVLADRRGADFILRQMNDRTPNSALDNAALWIEVNTWPILTRNQQHMRAFAEVMTPGAANEVAAPASTPHVGNRNLTPARAPH